MEFATTRTGVDGNSNFGLRLPRSRLQAAPDASHSSSAVSLPALNISPASSSLKLERDSPSTLRNRTKREKKCLFALPLKERPLRLRRDPRSVSQSRRVVPVDEGGMASDSVWGTREKVSKERRSREDEGSLSHMTVRGGTEWKVSMEKRRIKKEDNSVEEVERQSRKLSEKMYRQFLVPSEHEFESRVLASSERRAI